MTKTAHPEADAPPYRGYQALVVESDPVVRAYCRKELEALGFRVETAESGVTAVMSVRDELPDIAVLGRQLRDVSAKEAIHWLRVQPGMRGLPVIVLGGMADAGQTFVVPNLFVLQQHPLTAAELAKAVAKALGRDA